VPKGTGSCGKTFQVDRCLPGSLGETGKDKGGPEGKDGGEEGAEWSIGMMMAVPLRAEQIRQAQRHGRDINLFASLHHPPPAAVY